MLTYVIASLPAPTKALLGTPDETALAPVLADAIKEYDNAYTTEAQCTDTVRFNAIGLAYFWQWALLRIQSARFDPVQGTSSEFEKHVAEFTRLRDWYWNRVPGGMASAPGIILTTITGEQDPYVYPRYEDRV